MTVRVLSNGFRSHKRIQSRGLSHCLIKKIKTIIQNSLIQVHGHQEYVRKIALLCMTIVQLCNFVTYVFDLLGFWFWSIWTTIYLSIIFFFNFESKTDFFPNWIYVILLWLHLLIHTASWIWTFLSNLQQLHNLDIVDHDI